MDQFLARDFARIPEEYWRGLEGSTVVVTGATGFLGSLFVRFLQHLNMRYLAEIEIIGVVRDVEKAKTIFGEATPTLLHADLSEVDRLQIAGKVDLIVHAAAVTTSAAMVNYPVDLIRIALHGTELALKLAHEKSARLLYMSSMEVYGSIENDLLRGENEIGHINLSSVRSCYPESKRMCEAMCSAYVHQHGVDAVVARPALTFGAGALSDDSRVAIQFARSAAMGEAIVLRTEGRSVLNSVYSSDAIAALLIIALRGVAGETYNITNEESRTTVLGLAEAFSVAMGRSRDSVHIQPADRNDTGFAPDTQLRLSAEKLKNLGWHPNVSLEVACKLTGEYVRHSQT